MGEGTSVSAVSSEGRLPARAFEVISGDPKLVERCDIASKLTQLRTSSDPI